MIGSAVAVVCSCIAGSIWYNPKSPTGRLWMRRYHPGKSPEECGSEMGVAMGLTLVANLMMSLLLRFILIDTFHATSLLDGVKFGVGLSCLTTLLDIPHVLFSKRYVDAFIVDQVYNLIITTAAAVCIVYFG